jgi:hypothetical protein
VASQLCQIGYDFWPISPTTDIFQIASKHEMACLRNTEKISDGCICEILSKQKDILKIIFQIASKHEMACLRNTEKISDGCICEILSKQKDIFKIISSHNWSELLYLKLTIEKLAPNPPNLAILSFFPTVLKELHSLILWTWLIPFQRRIWREYSLTGNPKWHSAKNYKMVSNPPANESRLTLESSRYES